MAKVKRAIEDILNCTICNGEGISDKWISPDGDFDFEWCDCNPYHLTIADF